MFRIRDYSALLPLTDKELSRLLNRYRVDENGCWIWTGCRDRAGYGIVGLRYRTWFVHRLFHVLFVGPIPNGYVTDHLCRVRACCNPEHLEATTNATNVRRGRHPRGADSPNGRRTHCIHGHPFSEENTYIYMENGRPKRKCRTCIRNRVAQHLRMKYHKDRAAKVEKLITADWLRARFPFSLGNYLTDIELAEPPEGVATAPGEFQGVAPTTRCRGAEGTSGLEKIACLADDPHIAIPSLAKARRLPPVLVRPSFLLRLTEPQ